MATSPVTLAVEGETDAEVARRLLEEAGFEVGPVYVRMGKAALDARLAGYNEAARRSCWLVLRDLDHDATCAPALRARLLPAPAAPGLRLHVVVRSLEAWMLADARGVASWLGVPIATVPSSPEQENDPKRRLLELAGRSRRRRIREALLPAPGTTARVGPGYTSTLFGYIRSSWAPEAAEVRAPSLARLRAHLANASSRGECPR